MSFTLEKKPVGVHQIQVRYPYGWGEKNAILFKLDVVILLKYTAA
jgi:hypothetical protein